MPANNTNTPRSATVIAPVSPVSLPARGIAAVAKAVRLIRSGQTRLLLSVPLYRFWWRLRGLDFGVVLVEDLGLTADRASQHKDGGGPLLADLLAQLDIEPSDCVLDIGAGKGGAMATLAQFPFERVDGVEINRDLVVAARQNLTRLKLRQCSVEAADATTYTDLDRYTYIFMYNPFPAAVMKEVLANIAESLRRAPRRLQLIYSNPLEEETILAAGLFKQVRVYEPYPDYRITVYESKTAAARIEFAA